VLPKLHHQHDKKWIEEQLKKLPPSALATAIKGYEKVFSESYDNEPIEHAKENAARRAANTRLRLYVQKVISAR
jgi:hypothetical protein